MGNVVLLDFPGSWLIYLRCLLHGLAVLLHLLIIDGDLLIFALLAELELILTIVCLPLGHLVRCQQLIPPLTAAPAVRTES